jgi:hypothetical protein
MASAIRANLKLRRAVSDEISILSHACFAGLMGFCLTSVTELTFLRQWVVVVMFIFLGITEVLIHIDKRKEETDDDLGMTVKYENACRPLQGENLIMR